MDRQKKLDRITVAYDKDADVLYMTEGKPRKAICQMLDEGLIIRRDPKSKKVIGFTIIDFISRYSKARPRFLPIKAHFSLEKVVGAGQAYFWKKKWQEAEKEAENDIRMGKVKKFEDIEDLKIAKERLKSDKFVSLDELDDYLRKRGAKIC